MSVADIEKFRPEKRLKSLNEFDEEPLYILQDERRTTNPLLVAMLGLTIGTALGLVIISI
jgi:hypothetical protein